MGAIKLFLKYNVGERRGGISLLAEELKNVKWYVSNTFSQTSLIKRLVLQAFWEQRESYWSFLGKFDIVEKCLVLIINGNSI